MRNRCLATLLLLYLLPAAGIEATTPLEVEIPPVVKDCLERNLPETTSAQVIELRTRDRSGFEQVLQSNVYLKRYADGHSRVLMSFEEPVDVRGARFLIIQQQPQNDMYIYMPGLFKVRKITSKKISGSVLGTDFSYEDFERLYGILSDLKAEQYPDDVLNGRPVHVLNFYPAATSEYVKIANYIDKETCVPLKIDLFESGYQLRKTLTVNPGKIKQAGKIRVPGELLMRDLRDETETRLIVQNIQTGVILDDSLFTPEQMKEATLPTVSTDQ